MNNKNRRYPEAGRSFAEGGTTDEALLVTYGALAGWTAGCDSFEAAFGQQDSAVGSRIAKNAEINDKLSQIIALKTTISHMVPNFCSGNPGAIAAWNSAATSKHHQKEAANTLGG